MAKASSTTKRAATTKKSSAPAKSSAAKGNTVISTRKSAAPKKAGSKTPPKDSLEKIMKDMVKDIYYAEKKIDKALSKMAKSATHEELKTAFLNHKEQTQGQIERLNQVFSLMGMKPASKRCPAMDGILDEGNEEIEEYDKGAGRDAAMIVSAQKVEHYEIAAYGSLRTFASTLGYSQIAALFEETLQEESETDDLLTQLAHTINEDAIAGSADEEEE